MAAEQEMTAPNRATELVAVPVPRWMVGMVADVLRQEASRVEADAASRRTRSAGRTAALSLAAKWRALADKVQDHA